MSAGWILTRPSPSTTICLASKEDLDGRAGMDAMLFATSPHHLSRATPYEPFKKSMNNFSDIQQHLVDRTLQARARTNAGVLPSCERRKEKSTSYAERKFPQHKAFISVILLSPRRPRCVDFLKFFRDAFTIDLRQYMYATSDLSVSISHRQVSKSPPTIHQITSSCSPTVEVLVRPINHPDIVQVTVNQKNKRKS